MPEFDMVVTLTGGSYWRAPSISPHRIVMDYVLPAVVATSAATAPVASLRPTPN